MSDPKHTFTTSHAKSINMGPENSLDRVPSVKEQFEKAKAAQRSLEKSQSKPNTFTTSVAKTVQMGKPNSLDRVPSVKGQFDKAKTAQSQQQNGSEMVKRDRPQHNSNPPAYMRGPSDRQSFGTRLTDEQKRAVEMHEAAKIRNKSKSNLELNNGDKNNDDRGR